MLVAFYINFVSSYVGFWIARIDSAPGQYSSMVGKRLIFPRRTQKLAFAAMANKIRHKTGWKGCIRSIES